MYVLLNVRGTAIDLKTESKSYFSEVISGTISLIRKEVGFLATTIQMKQQATEWEKISTINTCGRGLISKELK